MKYSKAAVWNQYSTFAKFYLRDMSQQAANLHTFGPIVVVQKVVAEAEGGGGGGGGGGGAGWARDGGRKS